MIIKSADDKTRQIADLEALLADPGVAPGVRSKVEIELKRVASGIRGEREAAYEIDFYYGTTPNWAVIHDLRLEVGGRVAQIDHLLINRGLMCFVIESKSFAEGVAVNEQGEFSAFRNGRAHGIASPDAQNRKHIEVLKDVFEAALVEAPRRFGFAMSPSFASVVLVSKNARISRPKGNEAPWSHLVKADQLDTWIMRHVDTARTIMALPKLVAADTVVQLGQSLAALHQPQTWNFAARFGIGRAVVDPPPPPPPEICAAARPKARCASCGADVDAKVAFFCRVNKPRFGGRVLCRDCQRAPASA